MQHAYESILILAPPPLGGCAGGQSGCVPERDGLDAQLLLQSGGRVRGVARPDALVQGGRRHDSVG